MIGCCALCGTVGLVDLHHLGGRCRRGGPYSDDFTIALNRACHSSVHVVLRTVGLEFVLPDVHPTSHRLRRVALHVSLVTDAGRPFVVEPAAGPAFAAMLRSGADAIAGVR